MNNLNKAYEEFKEWLEVVDQYTDMISDDWSCKKGCSYCCSQLIFMRRIETSYLTFHLKKLKRKTRKTIRKQLKEWNKTYASFIESNNIHRMYEIMKESNRNLYFQKDNECPFLNRKRKTCYIYDYRPIACRTHFVTTNPEYCSPNNKTQEIQYPDHSILTDKLDPALDELEKKYDLLNDGKRLFDTFHLIFNWDKQHKILTN